MHEITFPVQVTQLEGEQGAGVYGQCRDLELFSQHLLTRSGPLRFDLSLEGRQSMLAISTSNISPAHSKRRGEFNG